MLESHSVKRDYKIFINYKHQTVLNPRVCFTILWYLAQFQEVSERYE